jgi:hypothetical protein
VERVLATAVPLTYRKLNKWFFRSLTLIAWMWPLADSLPIFIGVSQTEYLTTCQIVRSMTKSLFIFCIIFFNLYCVPAFYIFQSIERSLLVGVTTTLYICLVIIIKYRTYYAKGNTQQMEQMKKEMNVGNLQK